MWKRLAQAIARHRRSAGLWPDRARDLLVRAFARRERDQEDRRLSADRARFWAELREGQREAEAHSSSRDL